MYQGVVWLGAEWLKRPYTRGWSGCVLGDLNVPVPGGGLFVCWVA